MKKICFFTVLLMIAVQCLSQTNNTPWLGNSKCINGYAREISGESVGSTSAFPGYATTALITRSTDGHKTIEWETAAVPKKVKGKYIYFSWVAGHSTGTSSGIRNYDLYINDKKLLTFTTLPGNKMPDWTYAAADSSRILFLQKRKDGFNNAHGLAFLRLPVSSIKKGFPVKIKVVGQAQNSNDWYMTFKFSLAERADIEARPFILKNGQQLIALTAFHFENNESMKVMVNHSKKYSFQLQKGINKFDIPIQAVSKDDSVFISVVSGKNILFNQYLAQHAVIYRELDFIHHSHTDIGYSHLQPEVLKKHIKNIDDALHMIGKTKDFPADARFKWNIESAWVVDHYMQQASSEQKEKFIKAVKEGSICISALYANMLTGLSQPEEMFHYTDYAQKLGKEYGLMINSAMISDVPGYTWNTVTALAKGGVKYFSSGPNFMGLQNPYWGDRVGHFVKTWGDKPVWWQSPSGEERILFWTASKGYSSWHGTPIGGVFEVGPAKIAAYLNELEKNKYPYEIVLWRYGVIADNGPIDSTISDFVDQWNKKYASPKIVLNTTDKLFETFEKRYGDQLRTVKGDISPYWEDGAISSAAEEGKNRVNSLRLQQLGTLYSMLHPKQYDQQKVAEVWKNILLFHEHTWGANNSISEPDKLFVTEQWRIKKQYMLDADSAINQLSDHLLQPITDISSRKIAVFNSASFQRSEPVTITLKTNAHSVKDAAGKIFPLQKLSKEDYVFMAHDVPALGTAWYELSDDIASNAGNPFIVSDSSLSNGKVYLYWDRKNGSITRLEDEHHFNYAGNYHDQGLNSYWYVPGLIDPAQAVTNSNVKVRIEESGPVMTRLSIVSEAPGANQLVRNITLYAGSREVAIDNSIDKKSIRTKESVHFGFPFNASFTQTKLDAGYGSMRYMDDQLPGSDFDYLCARRWIDVSDSQKGIQMMLLQSPMVEPAGMIDERKSIEQRHKAWKKEGVATSTWFSYAMNNYWHTNYKADQEGWANFKYVLRMHGSLDETEMEKAGTSFTQPLIALPVKKELVSCNQLFELSNQHVEVTSIEPQQDGSLLIRLFNPEPTMQQTNIVWRDLKPAHMILNAADKELGINDAISLAGKAVKEVFLN